LLWELVRRQRSGSKRSGAGELFNERIAVSRRQFPPEKNKARLHREFEALGFLCDRHPMVLYADTLKNKQIVKAVNLHHFTGRQVRIAGLLITGKVVHTKHGDPMEFLTFEDETGLVETILFPEVYRRFCGILDRSRPYILHGKVEEDFGAVTMTVNRVEPLHLIERDTRSATGFRTVH